jgi:putative endopeptidase
VDPANAELRKGYEAMLAKFFALAGLDNAEKRAANAAGLEDKLAQVSWTSVENRDMEKIYNPMSSAQIYKAFPGFDFKTFFAALGIPDQDKIIVEQPSYFAGFSKIFKNTDLEVLKDYVAAGLINSAAGNLSDDFYDANFDFYSRQMSGVTEQKPRWKRAMSVPNSILGEAVGQMYVAKFFPESSKQKMLDLVKNLQISLGQHIDSLEWMSDATKAKAREKLAAFTVKIGYPDKWKDYSTLTVDPELSYLDNLVAASAWYVADNLSKIGKPTDPTEWGMTPQTVNAYYNPTTNEICFPAGILQPPFFNPEADDAVNYGAIGVVIGHEMTHGFDDQGSLFDKDGNMNNWWTDEDRAAFVAKTKVLADQYSEVEIVPGLMANGALTLGENIADHGGISIAWTALHNALGENVPAPIDGFTAEQRFFLGYAHVWAQNITDEESARLTKLDVHSLGKNRVNVALRNFGIFFDAFGIKEGDAMWRPEAERVHIW